MRFLVGIVVGVVLTLFVVFVMVERGGAIVTVVDSDFSSNSSRAAVTGSQSPGVTGGMGAGVTGGMGQPSSIGANTPPSTIGNNSVVTLNTRGVSAPGDVAHQLQVEIELNRKLTARLSELEGVGPNSGGGARRVRLSNVMVILPW